MQEAGWVRTVVPDRAMVMVYGDSVALTIHDRDTGDMLLVLTPEQAEEISSLLAIRPGVYRREVTL
jgi:hypothetical protein